MSSLAESLWPLLLSQQSVVTVAVVGPSVLFTITCFSRASMLVLAHPVGDRVSQECSGGQTHDFWCKGIKGHFTFNPLLKGS